MLLRIALGAVAALLVGAGSAQASSLVYITITTSGRPPRMAAASVS